MDRESALKNKRIRVFVITLIVCLVLLVMAGCTSQNTSNTSGDESQSSSETEQNQDQSSSDDQGSGEDQNSNDNGTSESEDNQSLSEKNSNLSFDHIPTSNVISVDDLKSRIDSGSDIQIIDIRANRSYGSGHIPGARNIPAGRQLELRANEIRHGVPTILVARNNNDHVAESWQTLVDMGYDQNDLLVLDGGMVNWENSGGTMQQERQLGC